MANLNRSQLVVRSLLHYWRTNLAVVLGVVAGTAVIGGALVVGDSVKASLRQMTLDRLGKIDFVLSGPRFVREQLAEEISRNPDKGEPEVDASMGVVAPAIVMQAGLQSKLHGSIRRAGRVNVYGFDDRVWPLIETDNIARPTQVGVVLNARAAEAVNAKIGDEVTLWIEIPSAVPRDTLMGKKDNDSQEITLTVTAIAPESSGLARLGLQPTQALPLNAFVDLHVLQERLGLEEVKPNKKDPSGKVARINALFNSRDFEAGSVTTGSKQVKAHIPTTAETLTQGKVLKDAMQRNWTLADLNLRLVNNKSAGGIVLESEQMILEDKLAAAAVDTANEMNLTTAPVMVYLANKLWNRLSTSPASDRDTRCTQRWPGLICWNGMGRLMLGSNSSETNQLHWEMTRSS